VLGSRPAVRSAALVAVLALAAGVAAGCSANTPEATPTKSAQPSGPTLLSFAVYGPPQVITAYATIAANYTAEHPNVAVSVRPYSSADAAQKALASEIGTGDEPDVFLSPVTALPALMAVKAIRRVDELLGERDVDFGDGFQRYSLEAFSSDNALQCMPVDVSPMVVYYNTALVDLTKLATGNQPPVTAASGWSFDQFAQAARSARGKGIRGVYVEPSLDQVAPFIFSGGGNLTDDKTAPTTLVLDDGSTKSSLERLLELVRDPLATFNEKQINRVSALQRFKNGQLAMIVGYRDLTPELRTQQNLDFDVMPMPRVGGRTTTGRSSGLCLSSASDHADKAADFLAYAVSDASSTILAETGFTVPTNVDVVHSDSFLQPGQRPVSADVFDDNVRYIRAFPTAPTWPAVVAATDPLLTRLFYDPVIEPFDDRLTAIDEASVPVFNPPVAPTPTATPSTP
jgi:multiple sugar transport system substrate-binding protein